ncbi:hypothetical protein [Dactylosporangium darangshiense]|uniref:Uncharacterized protein n=1 Tax=Dactylosporangium darangshiense TaxID=579108 RepID=A0ABP8D928_9ACTN
MDAGMKDLESLAVLDPSRGREPTDAEWTRSRAFIERTMATSEGRPARHRAARWLVVGAATVATGAAAAVIVPAVLPGTAQKAMAAWTAVPTARTGDQVLPQARECADNEVGGRSATVRPDDVVLAEQRGIATLLIMRKSGKIVECLSAGGHNLASMGLIDDGPLPAPPPGQVSLETMSSMGNRGHEWSNIIGLVGPGVTGVEVRLDNGRVVQASVKAGWWAAWWPGPEGGDFDHLTVIVHTATTTTSRRPSELP